MKNRENLNKPDKPIDLLSIKEQILKVLQNVYDPEIPVDIYSLGMIYNLSIDENANVRILMTLTAPNCPVAEALPVEVKARVAAIPNINSVDLELTFDPPWSRDMMSDSAKVELGVF